MPKEHVAIFALLCIIAFGLGYWYSTPKGDSDERAEVSTPPVPTIVTNVVTNTLKEVVTNIVAAKPQPTPTPTPVPVKPQPRPQPTPAPTPTPAPVKPQPIAQSNRLLAMGAGRGIAKGWNPIIEAAIREHLKKPMLPYNKSTGNWPKNHYLTEADLEKVTELFFSGNQLTDVKGLEKLNQLTELWLGHNQLTSVKGLEKLTQLKLLDLRDNPDLTKAKIDQLQKALPKCGILSNPKK